MDRNISREAHDNIIFIPYANKDGAKSGVESKQVKNRQELYLKNCCVALISAKYYNPNDDVALVTNIEVPQRYKDLLEAKGIMIIHALFDEFVFPDDYPWNLAFYKLCALSFVLGRFKYKRVAYMDSDVYVQSSFATIWEECDQSILLYDINHGLQVGDYQIITKEAAAFLGDKKLVTHYGGEFFASGREDGIRFVDEAKDIYTKMIDGKSLTTKGDEFILSIAADRMTGKVKNAGAYVYRFWTNATFHLISTCYEFNPVTVIHVPAEKSRGMLALYKTIERGVIPSSKSVWRKLHLYKPTFRDKAKATIKKALKR